MSQGRGAAEKPRRQARGESRQGIQSIEVGGRLLAALAGANKPMMLKDLAEGARMSAPKAHRYLVSFQRMGLVEQDAASGRYDLGPFALDLGLASLGRLDPVRHALPALARLRDAIDETVALAVWGNHGATIVRWLESSQPVNAALRTGAVMPLTRSATGRAFLAFMPASATAALAKAELAANARAGLAPATRGELERIVAEARRHGIARSVAEFTEAISGFAAPVFDADGRMTLALVALGYSGDFDARWEGATARAVREEAETLSRRLGWSPARAA
ncbi:MAG: IclR family transcriptional regulator [Burkholderiales bacterium]|nr:IclR family transcriptional regulator [Burkholderiales bacterium]